jgi:hypothetical protein
METIVCSAICSWIQCFCETWKLLSAVLFVLGFESLIEQDADATGISAAIWVTSR